MDKEKQIDNHDFWNGFFYFFGLIENPAENKAKEVLEGTPGEKLRQDVRRVNGTLKETYSEMKRSVLSVNE